MPRVWEKFEDALKEKALASPELLKKFSAWAKGHAYAKVMDQSKGILPSGLSFKIASAYLNKIK